MRIIIMAGTSDAVDIIELISADADIDVIATTTTSYGGDIALASGANEALVGALDTGDMVGLIEKNQIDLLIDATHPFASEATLTAIKSTKKAQIPYLRFERASIKLDTYENLFFASNFDEAAEIAIKLTENLNNKRIMHLAGVTTLPQMIKKIPVDSLIVRVLPAVYSIKKCAEYGIPSENIIAMQGIFSKEFNKSLMSEYNVDMIVTKESGESGGTISKIEAAISLGIPVVIVKRPKIPELENEMVFSDIKAIFQQVELLK
jgi:precorrin-6A/cobalt-precorrin-6A reductase